MTTARDAVRATTERLASYVEPRTECAWCGTEQRAGPEPTSHTICPPCEAKFFGPHRNAAIEPEARHTVAQWMRAVHRDMRAFGASRGYARTVAKRVRRAAEAASGWVRVKLT